MMGQSWAVEIVYRGIFQKNLAKHISRALVLAAVREGKTGISFGRYGDSPERNGIPAKNFAIIATDDETLQESMARYEPTEVDVTIAVDDVLCKGVESWAWYGLQPINKLTKPNRFLVVTTRQSFDDLLRMTHTKDQPYTMALVRGIPSFSGLWVYKDDHTDVRVLGAVARLLPEMVGIDAIAQAILEEWGDAVKVASARKAHERVETRLVQPGEGNPEQPFTFDLLRWQEMREGVTIPSIARGGAIADPITGEAGGYRPARNATFKKYTTRTMRPVVDFDKCIKCTLCWLQCPDSVFDVTPDGLYDAHMEACCGCGVCEAVCPVDKCVSMVNENAFTDNASQWEMWRKDPAAYGTWVQEKIKDAPHESMRRAHGFRVRGQYEQEIAAQGGPGADEAAGATVPGE